MSPTPLILLFAAATYNQGLPPGLLSALCFVESGHRADAVHKDDGHSNSVGVCQIKRATSKTLGFKGTEAELKIPVNNINYSSRYLKKQLDRYHGDIKKAVAAYNAGAYRTDARGRTRNSQYVKKVFAAWKDDR